MKNIIRVFIDRDTIRVDDDRGTAYRFGSYFIDKLRDEGILANDELARFGFDIFNNIFSTRERRQRFTGKLDDLQAHENLIITVSTEYEEIHDIPFEIINLDGTEAGFLLKRGNCSLVRNIPTLDKRIQPSAVPIKILILLSLPLETYRRSPFNPLRELDIIYSALDDYLRRGLVTIDVEEKADKNRIRERVLKGGYHIVHFTGHGSRGGYLCIEDEADNAREKFIGADEIRDIFHGSQVRLFYFDACETAEATELEPSLAYHIYKGIPTAYVLANIARMRDDIATETTRHIYTTLFEGGIENVLNKARLMMHEDWWKPVLFAESGDENPFDIKGAQSKAEKMERLVKRPAETARNYVYRYGIVRKASNLIEDQSHLVLHGTGGAGKSTTAQYLSRFFDARFNNILFFDLKDRSITQPDALLNAILDELAAQEFMDYRNAEAISNSAMSDVVKNRKKWTLIKENLQGKTLLILDNLEETIQDEKGVIRPEWKDLLNDILNTENIFSILTSRIKVRLSDRMRLGNTLEIGEYTPAEFHFLLRDLEDDTRRYLTEHFDEIRNTLGLHPLSISLAIDKRFDGIQRLLDLEEFKGCFEFYRRYFTKYETDARRLFCLEYPFSQKFLENFLTPDFVSLIRDSLMILHKEDDHLFPYRILTSYFKRDFTIRREDIKGLQDDLISIYDRKGFQGIDTMNIFTLLMFCYEETGDKGIEEKLTDVFNDIPGVNVQNRLTPEVIDSFVTLFSHFTLEDDKKAGILNNLGVLYLKTGKYKKAREHLDAALRIRRVLAEENEGFLPDLAKIINNLGNLCSKIGQYRESEEYYTEALKIYRTVSEKSERFQPDLTGTLSNLGVLYSNTGRPKKAEKYLTEALLIRRALAEKNKRFQADLAGTLNNLGNLYRDTGKLKEAEEHYTESLRLKRALSEENEGILPDLAVTLNNLGALYSESEKHKDAEEHYTEALRIYRILVEKSEEFLPNLAMTLNNLGNLYWNTGKHKEAEENLSEALRIRSALSEKSEGFLPDLASTLNNLGALYSKTGKHKEAEKHYTEALRICRMLTEKSEGYLSDLALILNNLGVLNSDTGKHKEAEEHLTEALEIYKEKKNFPHQFRFYPSLITALARMKVIDYPRLAEPLCNFLELFDVFSAQEPSVSIAIIRSFIEDGIFKRIDVAKINEHIQYPVCKQRLESFLKLLESFAPAVDKDAQKDSL